MKRGFFEQIRFRVERELFRLLRSGSSTKEKSTALVVPPVVSPSPVHALKDYQHLLDVDPTRYLYSGSCTVVASPAMQNVLHLCQRFAPSRATVLITGETGTGKEHLARIIHELSKRPGPYLRVNCGAPTKDLFTSLLFGHRRGAFTGAVKDQRGLFEDAHLGSILFDEIGELPLDMQAVLLRVLDDGEILPAGYTRPKRVDVRVICATNRDLRERVEAGVFREDLFYRLTPLEILAPPLCERPEDILMLAAYFLRRSLRDRGVSAVPTLGEAFTDSALEALLNHPWNGNVRELCGVVERTVLHTSRRIDGRDLRFWSERVTSRNARSGSIPGRRSRRGGKRIEINNLRDIEVDIVGGKKKKDVAKHLGVSRQTLWRRRNGR